LHLLIRIEHKDEVIDEKLTKEKRLTMQQLLEFYMLQGMGDLYQIEIDPSSFIYPI